MLNSCGLLYESIVWHGIFSVLSLYTASAKDLNIFLRASIPKNRAVPIISPICSSQLARKCIIHLFPPFSFFRFSTVTFSACHHRYPNRLFRFCQDLYGAADRQHETVTAYGHLKSLRDGPPLRFRIISVVNGQACLNCYYMDSAMS